MADDARGAVIGAPVTRIDGPLKVTGRARYPSDDPMRDAAWAWLVTSSIARGRISGFDLAEARATRGVIDILTHENVGGQVKSPAPGNSTGGVTTTLESDQVWHEGQIVAVVLAQSLEAAREGARRVKVAYAAEKPAAGFDSPGAEAQPVAAVDKSHKDPKVGDALKAFAAGAVTVDQRYSTPTQHHNPMELFATTCAWDHDRLTIWEASQHVYGLKTGVARQLGVPADKVRVLSKFIGGGFGSKGGATARTAWIALAARRLNRPVKLVATRDQGFTIATYRAETRHRIRLAAGRDGRLTALIHEAEEVTSRPSNYNVSGVATTARLYGCPNVLTKVSVVHADRNTPGFMRAPPETPYLFPLEQAMDELAVALNMDPVELRRINDTQTEPIEGRRYTSRSLNACYAAAGKAFGWERRDPRPGSMRDGDWLIGWGCATACYPANIGAATCRVRLSAEGAAKVQIAAQDLGTGSYTIIAQVAADRLGIPVHNVYVELGDSDLPPAGLSAGSQHAASICNAVAKGCEQLRDQLARAAVGADGPLKGRDPAGLTLAGLRLRAPDGRSEPLAKAVSRVGGVVEVYAENIPKGAPPDSSKQLYAGGMAMARGSELKDQIRYSFGAQFVEVRVHARTREVRAPRAVGAFAAGTIVNPVTARSQLMGGMIWGLSAALHEETEIDRRLARYTNDNLADYLTPVNADIGVVEVVFVPEEDRLINDLGIKGVGELGTTGMNAAVANAVWHATGRRIRDLPVRIEDLL